MIRPWSMVLCFALATSCTTPSTKPADPTPKDTDSTEAAGLPAPNTKFLDPKMDPESWSQRFESPKREVFAHRDALVAELHLAQGQVVADVGAGSGAFLEPLSRGVGSMGKVYAVEISPRFLAYLGQRKTREGWDNVEVVRSTANASNLPRGQVDLIYTCDTYHHFDDAPAFVTDLFGALKPGGRLVVVDFDRRPGISAPWILKHVQISRAQIIKEVRDEGFEFVREPTIEGLRENMFLEFRRPE